MRKKDMKKLALLGLAAGFLTSSHVNAAETKTPAAKKDASSSKSTDASKTSPNDENEGYHLMTEDELLSNINKKSLTLYESLDAEGKALTLKVASQRCQATNECKGLNACKTDKNECAGQGGCKGQSKCAFADKNLVVKLVAKKMADKRSDALKK